MPHWFVSLLTVRVLTLGWVPLEAKTIPDYLHVCHRSDPEMNVCITKSVESLRDKLIAGLPELGVPPIEPLIIEEPISTQGAGISVTTKDLKAYGGGNFTIKDLKVDSANLKYKFILGFDHLAIDGHYVVDGKIIMIPIKGDGDLKCDVYDVEGVVEMDSKVENVNGQNELRFLTMKVDVKVGNGKVHLGNLFGGDKLIGEVINAAINLNFQYFIKELKPIIQETLSHFMIKSANKICDGLNYDELAPE
uniref:Circadian clock-controlled protein n=3 Tax=Lygus hesperus TaxID=30085 RepID=A0A0K8SJR3_LYGHE